MVLFQGHKISTAIVAICAMLLTTGGAVAGSSTYDLNPILNEQHPFAGAPSSIKTYERQCQIAATADAKTLISGPNASPEADDTLVGLLGLGKRPDSASVQVAQTIQAGAAVGQLAAAVSAPAKTGDPSFLTVGGGWYDFNDNEQAAEFRIEWRSQKMFWVFKPFVGAMATSDAAIYGYGGFLTDFYFGRRIVVSPSFAVGLYEDGDGKDLGSVIEFRSGLEVGWRFDDRSRLSAMVYHISNTGIDDNNPGTEVFSIGYSFPLQ